MARHLELDRDGFAAAESKKFTFSDRLENHRTRERRLEEGRLDAGIGWIGALVFLAVVSIAFLTLIYTFGVVVPPGHMGVRQIEMDTGIGPSKQIYKTALEPGYHGNVPYIATIHILPTTWIPVHFNREKGRAGSDAVEHPPLKVKSRDGVPVEIDVTIMIRLYSRSTLEEEESSNNGHGGPANLLMDVGMTREQWFQTITAATNKHLGESLKRLNADDFYDDEKRHKMVSRGERALRKSLSVVGIEVGNVLLRRFSYENDQIEESIFKKNLQQVEYVLGVTNRKLAEEENITAKKLADIDRQIKVTTKNAEVQAQAMRQQAQAELVKAEAEGEAMVAIARAEIDQKKAGLLAKAQGADVFVARQLAPVLGTLKGGVVSGIDPYDLEGWLKRLGVDGITQAGGAK